jgi:NAD(P)H-dependent flavin oxidoreductase YrpB (nitropropane dioxygenase family)
LQNLLATNTSFALVIGHPKHVAKALAAGVDIICAQGTEGGGHTGDVASSVLLPSVVDICKGKKSPLTGDDVMVIAAGGMYDGRGLAAALAYGCEGVWVGTRFVAAAEAACPDRHKNGVVNAGPTDTTRTLIYSGRPLRTLVTDYVANWEARPDEIRALCDQGIVPLAHDMKVAEEKGEVFSLAKNFPMLMGQASGAIHSVETAQTIVDDMMSVACEVLQSNAQLVAKTTSVSRSRL